MYYEIDWNMDVSTLRLIAFQQGSGQNFLTTDQFTMAYKRTPKRNFLEKNVPRHTIRLVLLNPS
jgi:hypothetical protein